MRISMFKLNGLIVTLRVGLSALCLLSSYSCLGQTNLVANAGFEQGWDNWIESDKDGRSASISGDTLEGEKSAKLTSSSGTFAQVIEVRANTSYRLSAAVKGTGIVGVKLGDQLFFERQSSTKNWKTVSVSFNSGDSTRAIILAQHNGKKSLFDNFELVTDDVVSGISNQSITLAATGKSPDLPPGSNFDLLAWYLATPEPDSKGLSTRITERELNAGYQHPDYFYTADDGGMVFRATVAGARTSNNTKYTRTELREMLRKGDVSINTVGANGTPNANSWVFSTAPNKDKKLAGAVDGILKASLAVNHVTTTGEAYQIGRVIIGQIHASDDEPIRLYYRKLPNNDNGSIYAAHQPHGGKDKWYEIIGSRSNSADNPENGIPLNEEFDYEIRAKGNHLHVLISKGGELIGESQIDMSDSGFDRRGEYMYFKAGVYNQNNSGDPEDYVQATFYALEATH